MLAKKPLQYRVVDTACPRQRFRYLHRRRSSGTSVTWLATNRGIITNGPYRWVKHPAYLSKNLSWWLISLPFIPGAGWLVALQSCVLLGGVNAIYWLRAKTEERHLGADPTYRDYQAYIARHGLWARLKQLAARPYPLASRLSRNGPLAGTFASLPLERRDLGWGSGEPRSVSRASAAHPAFAAPPQRSAASR